MKEITRKVAAELVAAAIIEEENKFQKWLAASAATCNADEETQHTPPQQLARDTTRDF